MKITLDRETHERFKLYSEVTGKPMCESIEEALNFWMDTTGSVEILFETGIETVPELAGPAAPVPVTVN